LSAGHTQYRTLIGVALIATSLLGVLVLARLLADEGERMRTAPHPCHRGRYCPHNQIWAFAHSTPVRGQPGLRRFTEG
jgi:hypothetical protein